LVSDEENHWTKGKGQRVKHQSDSVMDEVKVKCTCVIKVEQESLEECSSFLMLFTLSSVSTKKNGILFAGWDVLC